MPSQLFSGGSSGTTCGTGELNGANNRVLGIHQFKTVEVDIAYLHGLAKAEAVDIDNKTLGNGGIGSAHLELLHRQCELTTGLNTFGVAFELNGHFDYNGLVFLHFEKVDVENGVLNRVELDILQDSHTGLTLYVELDSEDFGSIDELAHSLLRYYEVGSDEAFGAGIVNSNDFLAFVEGACVRKINDCATVKDNGDKTFAAESLGGLLAERCAGLS